MLCLLTILHDYTSTYCNMVVETTISYRLSFSHIEGFTARAVCVPVMLIPDTVPENGAKSHQSIA